MGSTSKYSPSAFFLEFREFKEFREFSEIRVDTRLVSFPNFLKLPIFPIIPIFPNLFKLHRPIHSPLFSQNIASKFGSTHKKIYFCIGEVVLYANLVLAGCGVLLKIRV